MKTVCCRSHRSLRAHPESSASEHVTLEKLFNFRVPQFPHIRLVITNCAYLTEGLINVLMQQWFWTEQGTNFAPGNVICRYKSV